MYVSLAGTTNASFFRWVDQNKSWLQILAEMEKLVGVVNPALIAVAPIGDMLDGAARWKAGKELDVDTAFRQKMARISESLKTEALVLQVLALVLDVSGVATAGAGTLLGLILQVSPPACLSLSKVTANVALGKDWTEDAFSLVTLLGPVAQGLKIPGAGAAATDAVKALRTQIQGNPAIKREIQRRTSVKGPTKEKTPRKTPRTPPSPRTTANQEKPKTGTALLLAAVGGIAAVAGAPVWVPVGAGALALLTLRKK